MTKSRRACIRRILPRLLTQQLTPDSGGPHQGFRKGGLCGCGSAECPSPGKHPITKFFPNGSRSATSDKLLVKRALSEFPHANVAVSTEGITIVDVDGDEGEDSVKKLDLPRTVRVRTRRGNHRYYLGELPGGSFKSQKLDVITGPARYVLAPPSRTADGSRYRFFISAKKQLTPVPSDLLNRLRANRSGRRELASRTRQVIKKGERNDFLFRLGCSLRRRITDEALVARILGLTNERLCEAPLSESELANVTKSVQRYDEKSKGQLFGPVLVRDPAPMEWLYYPYLPLFGSQSWLVILVEASLY